MGKNVYRARGCTMSSRQKNLPRSATDRRDNNSGGHATHAPFVSGICYLQSRNPQAAQGSVANESQREGGVGLANRESGELASVLSVTYVESVPGNNF